MEKINEAAKETIGTKPLDFVIDYQKLNSSCGALHLSAAYTEGYLEGFAAARSYWSEQLQKEKGMCKQCGGVMAEIRGMYPGEESRKVCPTCATEKLEQIHDISSKYYGQTAKNEIS